MVEQLNLLNQGQIISTALHTEMERSYLEYAMSVIVGRALPDVRDGLKPVHRRILYAMYELGLSPDRPFRKCARVVGDVLGKYHPHGDQAVYDAMVRLVQDFSSRYPLLAGHGNFGSVDNDPAAAMRYTETRLGAIAFETMLEEVNESTVDFSANFDNSQQEPVVLPAKLPILLLNGCSGIAVGMATNIPPHNLNEIVDGLIALIDQPDISDEKLMKLIPGPDFPTGGEIIDGKGIRDAYLTGKGIIPVRGVATIEELKPQKKRSRSKTAIIVTELPFQVNKAGWIEKVADLVNQGKINDIADIRDESDRTGIRVVIELKRDGNPQLILNQLYRQTALQSNFGVILLGLVNNKPCQLSLKEVLQEFLQFREETLTRQYNYELEDKQDKTNLLAGLIKALDNLDTVIDILRHAPDGTTAKTTLKSALEINEAQANSILAMPLRRLTGLERQKIEQEYDDLETRINQLKELLDDKKEFLKALKKELRSYKRKFGDNRRTKIITVTNTPPSAKTSSKKTKSQSPTLPLITSQELTDDAMVQISAKGKIYWQPQSAIASQPMIKQNTDLIIHQQRIKDKQEIIVILDSGKAYPLSVDDIPRHPTKQIIKRLISYSATKDNHQPINYITIHPENKHHSLVLLTTGGFIKRIAIDELDNIGNRGFTLIKLKPKDSLYSLFIAQQGQELVTATSGGRLLRHTINDENMSIMGKSAQGNMAVKLRLGEKIIGSTVVDKSENVLLISEMGYGKVVPVNNLRPLGTGKGGGLGSQSFRFKQKEDNLLTMLVPNDHKTVIVTTDSEQRFIVDVNKLFNNDGEKTMVKLANQEKITFALNWWGKS
ncbi:DNA topoisomerase 4 subunit A [Cyanobacterium stanieri LEGE 03274]|uniref:DNA topoisomerase (ATP-hydrolyzing) n=1 Tax=Cyanobacterium stanieri LEGE 03274 TaxID=1828756 RepID=A0ABR9V6A9_9CHRO|nr:DNA topoisomerase (ATP-hydrolyzing) [Cyanobacterium stanieri]MBE9222379.1 DNA topoisomerase 4 subunit A [Cyanobacterium stanieri LEGE 03274]